MKSVFGIDLGTTYSCIAYMDAYDKPVVLSNSEEEDTTPSVVMFDGPENIIVGNEAKRSVKVEPDKVVQFIKRKMGKEDDRIKVNGTEYSAPEVSSYILLKLVQDANSRLIQEGVIQEGEEIKDVVITCPAYFGLNEKKATRQAGELAKLNVLDIINEPTAAAISYGASRQGNNETVLIYDLGGGTFDITVMNIHEGNVTVICTGGDDQLGGKDWDEKFMDYIVSRYEEENGSNLYDDPDIISELYINVETWKKTLTTREKVTISVNGPDGRFREEISREKYEEITHDLLNRTRNLLDDVLREAEKRNYPLSKIDRILLVGGSSRMPQVAAMLQKYYNKKPTLQDPNLAVAKGAAIYAKHQKELKDFVAQQARQTGKSVEELEAENIKDHHLDIQFRSSAAGQNSIRITNVLSRTYGIKVLADTPSGYAERIYNMLKINDPLPATFHSQDFATVSNNQTRIDMDLYESRSSEEQIEIEGRVPLTTFVMKLSRAVPKGTQLDITLMLDNSGMIHIIAEDMLYHSKLDTTFQLSNQMSDQEMQVAGLRVSNAKIE